MARLIDEDDFLKRLNERPVDYLDPGCDFYYSVETVESVLTETPTVDAMEVVRCKDCKYSSCNPVKLTYGCNHPSGLRGFVNEGFYFCSYGERRTDEAG